MPSCQVNGKLQVNVTEVYSVDNC